MYYNDGIKTWEGNNMNNAMVRNIKERFERLCNGSGLHNFLEDYENHRIPDTVDPRQIGEFYNGHLERFYTMYEGFSPYILRSYLLRISSFSLITRDWVSELATTMKEYSKKEHPKVLEVCAGLGVLSFALNECGCDCIPTDSKTEVGTFNWDDQWMDVKELDWVDAVKKYGSDVDFVVCSWPRHGVSQVIKEFSIVNPGAPFIYIGEGWGGCTADDEFFEHSEKHYFQSFLSEVNRKYQRWEGIHDSVYAMQYID